MKLRLRLPTSATPVPLEVDDEAPWIGVLYEIESMTDIPVDEIKVLCGFPPKQLELAGDAIVGKCSLRNNDVLVIQKGTASVQNGNTGEKYVPPVGDRYHFTRRICPGDNSCLFHACAYVLCDKSRTDGPKLRRQCVEAVLNDPVMFNQETLGMSATEYAQWLIQPNSWGGGVELQILSFIYKTEIFALDLQSSTVQRFGTDEGYTVRGFVVYTGNHYDCIAMNPHYSCPSERDDQVLFNTRDDIVVERAKRFVKEEGSKATR